MVRAKPANRAKVEPLWRVKHVIDPKRLADKIKESKNGKA